MPRPNSPWYRKAKDAWYVHFNGRLHSLGVPGKNNRRAADLAFARLLTEPRKETVVGGRTTGTPLPIQTLPTPSVTVREAISAGLKSAAMRVKSSTLTRYTYDASVFSDAFGDLSVTALTPVVVAEWLETLRGTDTTKAIMLRSVSAVFGRAVAVGVMASNPARSVPRPRGRCRSASSVISPEDHAKLLAAATPQLRLVLRLLHATGARPGEVCKITAENFDAANGVVILTVHKTDHTGKPRLIFLSPDAVALLSEQRAKFPTGSLLRSNKGVAWTARSLTSAIRKLKKKAGTPNAIAYGYRHTFATDALARGVPDATVAALLGHTSTVVLHLHYSHLTSRASVLRAALLTVHSAFSAKISEPGAI